MTTDDFALMDALHHEHSGALMAFCLRLTGDRRRAEDVVQETFLRAWAHRQVLRQPSGMTRAWLFKVSRNIVIDDWRTKRSRVEVTTGDVPDARHEADIGDQVVLAEVISAALARLSQDHRTILIECYFNDGSVSDVARRLGLPSGTVKSRTHYALRSLRAQLAEMGLGIDEVHC